MPDLSVGDVDAYTNGRLAAADPETERLLAAGLDAARRYCGWHVTPILVDHMITLDGPGAALLVLPTLALQEPTSVFEDGVELDLADLTWSTRGLVRKKPLAKFWSTALGSWWSGEFGAIRVTMTHGFETAPWFDSAVLSYVDRTAQCIGVGQRETVGPFTFAETEAATGSAFTGEEQMILDKYKLEWMP